MILKKKARIIGDGADKWQLQIIDDCATTSNNCASGGCSGCACGKGANLEQAEVDKKVAPNYNIGDIVEIQITMPGQAVSAIVMFGIPIIFLLLGGVLGHFIAGEDGQLIGGLTGIAIAIVLINVMSRLVPMLRIQTEIIKIVD